MGKLFVLIAEDDELQRKLLSSQLERLGMNVHIAEDGESAWEQIQSKPIRLIITDWLMPGISGRELVERIRGKQFEHYIYVILLTSKDDSSDLISGLQAGADDYITKPFNPKELEARISVAQRILDLEDELRETRSKLERLAAYDSLTGLLNRRAFSERAAEELNRANRNNWPAGLIFFDIDKFKNFNDTYGHAVGDDVLRHLSEVVRKTIRPYDLFGRWAGDEFICLITANTRETIRMVAERVRGQVNDTLLEREGQKLSVTISMGLAYQEESQVTALDDILLKADEALYKAKEKGGNCVVEAED